MSRLLVRLSLLGLVLGTSTHYAAVARAGGIIDPTGDFMASYAGPKNPALDIVSANAIYDPVLGTITLTSTSAGPISGLQGTTNPNLGNFVWGINHGAATNAPFTSIGVPGVIFDAAVTLFPNGTATYRGNAAPAGSVTVSGNTITGVFSVAFLASPTPATAKPVEQWTYNIWPRGLFQSDGGPAVPAGNGQISDFAPNNEMFLAQVAAPEPSSLVLAGLGLAGAALVQSRRCKPCA